MSEQKEHSSGKFVILATKTLVRHQPKWFILTSLSSFFFFLTPLGLALITREIFDILTGASQLNFNIWTLVWLIPIAYVVQLITEITFSIFVWKFNLLNSILLRKNMIKGVFAQPGADSLEKSPSEAISRFRGDVQEVVWFTSLLGDITAFMIFAIVAFFIMYNVSSLITIIVFFPFILVVILINKSRLRLARYRDASRSASGRVTGAIGENFASIQSIKVASAEKNILKHFAKLNDEKRNAEVKDRSWGAVLRSTGKIVVSISTGIILLLVGSLMISGEFTLGDFTLFIFLLNWLTGFIRFLGEFLAWFHRNKVSYKRMLKIMQGETTRIKDEELLNISPTYITDNYPEIQGISPENDDILNLLEIRDLTYLYPKSENGIKNINMKLKKGSFTVIVGRVGSGKTTLLRSIIGLLPKQTGNIYWNKELISIPADQLIPPKIAYTSQVPVLFSETVKDNILMGLPSKSVNIEKATKLAVINQEISEFEDQMETKIGPKGVRLSGGQRHRLAAARMFAREPELLIFDDLSSALDVKTEEKLWEGLFEYPNSTFLVTSHRKYVLNRADQIIILENGKISDKGTLNELLERSEEMRQLREGYIDKVVEEEKISIKIQNSGLSISELGKIRRNYPTFLILELKNIIPSYFQYSLKIQNLYKSLVDLAFVDNEITKDELKILKKVLSNVGSYSLILQNALKDRIIDKNTKRELETAREKIYSEAYIVANKDKIISKDENILLEQIIKIVKELGKSENIN